MNDPNASNTTNSMDTSGIPAPTPTQASSTSKSASVSPSVAGHSNPFSPIAIYCPHGTEIFVGDSRGMITTVDADSKTIKSSFRVATNSNVGVKGLVVSSDKKRLLVNSSDRYLRLFNLPSNKVEPQASPSSTGPSGTGDATQAPSATLLNPVPELHKELIDAVNKQQWKTMIFSPDNELVLAGASHRHEHRIYFFTVYNGRLLKNLEGPKEGILDLTWHPTLPILVTVSTAGTIYVWGAHQEESWSAFTPGFTELEKNEEYIEREDEFDAEDPSSDPSSYGALPPHRKRPKLTETTEEEFVDVTTMEVLPGDSDDELDESELPEMVGLAKNVIADRYIPSIAQYPTLSSS
jgi:COMPASS component SWD1